MVKYSQSMREMSRVELEGFSEGSDYISQYIPTCAMIQIFSNFKNFNSINVLPGRAILEELVLLKWIAAADIVSHIAQ